MSLVEILRDDGPDVVPSVAGNFGDFSKVFILSSGHTFLVGSCLGVLGTWE